MRILLTGGTGFLGGRLAGGLAGAGHEVRALVRPRAGPVTLPPGVTPVAGDVTDPDSLLRAAAGVDAVVHAAALVRTWVPDRSAFDRVNVDGLRHVLAAARAAGVKRILYTSSFIGLGPTDGTVGDERRVHPGDARNDYERTKAEAVRVARAAAADGAPIVILYPGVIYGPGRLTEGSLLTRTIRDFMRRRVAYLGSGRQRICCAFIDDVVEGHRLALARAAPGDEYVLGGENVDYRTLFGMLARVTGVPAPRIHIPFRVMALAGRLLRWRARLTGAEPAITDEVVAIYRHDWAYASDRAERAIGYRITPLEEGLRRTVEWLRRNHP